MFGDYIRSQQTGLVARSAGIGPVDELDRACVLPLESRVEPGGVHEGKSL
jgi:hypothetical protein